MSIETSPEIVTERRSVGLVCKPGRVEIERLAAAVAQYLLDRDYEVKVDPGSCNVAEKGVTPTLIEDMDVDFVITIGGDGTILHTLQHLSNRETPLFCVNRGTVGFLTESSTTTALSLLEDILEGNCVIERCTNLASGVGKQRFPDALNEVYVASCVPGRLLTFQVYIDGNRVDYVRADGCMLATPCGSTAYALAAGGSILTPGVHAFIFVPVCPPRFEMKSLVIPDTCTMELELVKPGACCVAVIDGQTRWDVEPRDRVWIKKSESVTRFIRMYDNYYDRLSTRLVPRIL
ncbi:MAG: NAD(+)/NADH kinase [Candidatus Thorarchaeota archaeon]|nr:NAD(+)/NADH kinase [Candidatus Thorarchaeota archaeon]